MGRDVNYKRPYHRGALDHGHQAVERLGGGLVSNLEKTGELFARLQELPSNLKVLDGDVRGGHLEISGSFLART